MNTILLAGATASLLHATILAVAVAGILGCAGFAVALARAERRADRQLDRDARLIADLRADLRAVVDENDDREHREAELEAVLARKNEENQALSAVALDHADLSGISVFASLPHEQWPATVNGTRP